MPVIRSVILVFAIVLFPSCSIPENIETNSKSSVLPVLDVRVYSHYTTVINGESISSYQLGSTLKDLTVDSATNTRIFFIEYATIGMMQTLQNFIRDQNIKDSSIRVFSEHEMQQYFSKHIYMDRISENRILFNGDLIHPENLSVALSSSFYPDSTIVHYSIIDSTSIEQYFSDLETFEFTKFIIE